MAARKRMKKLMNTVILAAKTPNPTSVDVRPVGTIACNAGGNSQPPKNNKTIIADVIISPRYSAAMIKPNFIPEYSV